MKWNEFGRKMGTTIKLIRFSFFFLRGVQRSKISLFYLIKCHNAAQPDRCWLVSFINFNIIVVIIIITAYKTKAKTMNMNVQLIVSFS